MNDQRDLFISNDDVSLGDYLVVLLRKWWVVASIFIIAVAASILLVQRMPDVYEARTYKSLPYRLLPPLRIEPSRRYPLIISLHGSGGIGDDNLSNLRSWNGIMARSEWRKKYPCFGLVPQRRPGGNP